VHRGHRAAIDPAVKLARQQGGVVAVLTFWPHPSALFHPANPTRLIQNPDTKARVLGQFGVDAVITETFTTEFAAMAADEFLPWLKRKLPSLVAVYVGENFRFGHKRKGDIALLKQSGRALEIAVHSASPVVVDGGTVSSTRIRTHLAAGEIEAANALLGYPYFAEGTVVAGKRLGRNLGFPTLNLPWIPDLRPRFGVYAVRVSGAGSDHAAERLPGVANYGLRPTVENTTEPKLEVHLLGNCPFDTGDRITVEWLRFIRPETKFADLDALRLQISHDRDTATSWLSRDNSVEPRINTNGHE
jgi:riboflavin kinase/FMN adenylyltransferase